MSFETILVHQGEGVVTVTLNRPPVNALNATLGRELRDAFEQIEQDADARVVLLTGNGERAFAAGADIRELQTLGVTEAEVMSQQWHQLFRRMETFRLPIIAVVNGVAFGGGCELAMACDFRIASETARFGQPEINLGLIPGWGGTQRLPRLIGVGRALELLMTGDPIDASEALRIGLVNRVTRAEDLLDTAMNLARTLSNKGSIALKLIKECVYTGIDGGLDAGLAFETRQFGAVCGTDDKSEGVSAFLEKRPPVFAGR